MISLHFTNTNVDPHLPILAPVPDLTVTQAQIHDLMSKWINFDILVSLRHRIFVHMGYLNGYQRGLETIVSFRSDRIKMDLSICLDRGMNVN